jgi:hypothetical protein
MSPIAQGALHGALLAHQSGPIGFVLVLIPLLVLALLLRLARRRAERRLETLDAVSSDAQSRASDPRI